MKIAVIGAGVHGVIATKICSDYGFEVQCFEKATDIGGLWLYNPQAGRISVMKNTITNTSKEMMAFSDFPPPIEAPNFVHHTGFLKYLQAYAKQFNIRKLIQFQVEVLKIERDENYEQTGHWKITYQDLRNGEIYFDIFNGVMIASGRQTEPFWPHFDGIQNFTGRLLHSQDYKDDTGFENRRILVVGAGNSACDVACDLAPKCSQVYWSVSNGTWIINRSSLFGYPWDIILSRRLTKWLIKLCPLLMNFVAEFLLDLRFKHSAFGLKTKRRFFNIIPTINDEVQVRILTGQIKVEPGSPKFLTGNAIEFQSGSIVHNIDDIIMCTGYKNAFPFLEADIVDVKDKSDLDLYKFMYPPHLGKHPTLCFIGNLQPRSALIIPSEIQARFYCEVLSKRVKLPDDMVRLTDEQIDSIRRRYGNTTPYNSAPVDGLEYADDLAEAFGAKPNIWLIVRSGNFRLASCLIFGPMTPYRYRLQGPHPWIGARDAVMNAWNRAMAPLRVKGDLTERRRTTLESIRPFFLLVFACATAFVLMMLYS